MDTDINLLDICICVQATSLYGQFRFNVENNLIIITEDVVRPSQQQDAGETSTNPQPILNLGNLK